MRSIRHIIYACTVLILSMGMSGCFDEVSSLEVEEKPGDDIHEKKESQQEGNSELQVSESIKPAVKEDGTVVYLGKKYVDADPPYPYMEKDMLPDFLTEEQKILYRQAASIFSIFTEDPGLINRFYEWEEGVESVGAVLEKLENGGSYSAVYGKYKLWDDFIHMVHSVFTEAYYDELNSGYLADIPLFAEVDGITYTLAVTKTFNPEAEIIPSVYELVADTDTEIVIRVNTGYRYEEENGYRIEPVTYEVKMVYTEEGWRFSQFNSFMNCVLSNSVTG